MPLQLIRNLCRIFTAFFNFLNSLVILALFSISLLSLAQYPARRTTGWTLGDYLGFKTSHLTRSLSAMLMLDNWLKSSDNYRRANLWIEELPIFFHSVKFTGFTKTLFAWRLYSYSSFEHTRHYQVDVYIFKWNINEQ